MLLATLHVSRGIRRARGRHLQCAGGKTASEEIQVRHLFEAFGTRGRVTTHNNSKARSVLAGYVFKKF